VQRPPQGPFSQRRERPAAAASNSRAKRDAPSSIRQNRRRFRGNGRRSAASRLGNGRITCCRESDSRRFINYYYIWTVSLPLIPGHGRPPITVNITSHTVGQGRLVVQCAVWVAWIRIDYYYIWTRLYYLRMGMPRPLLHEDLLQEMKPLPPGESSITVHRYPRQKLLAPSIHLVGTTRCVAKGA